MDTRGVICIGRVVVLLRKDGVIRSDTESKVSFSGSVLMGTSWSFT